MTSSCPEVCVSISEAKAPVKKSCSLYKAVAVVAILWAVTFAFLLCPELSLDPATHGKCTAFVHSNANILYHRIQGFLNSLPWWGSAVLVKCAECAYQAVQSWLSRRKI